MNVRAAFHIALGCVAVGLAACGGGGSSTPAPPISSASPTPIPSPPYVFAATSPVTYFPVVFTSVTTASYSAIGTLVNAPVDATSDTNNNVYFTDGTSVFVYKVAANGVVSQTRSFSGTATFTAIAADASGDVFATTKSASVQEYGPSATGSSTPIATVAGATTTLQNPIAVAVDSTGKIYVGDTVTTCPSPPSAAILIFSSGASGNVAPATTVCLGFAAWQATQFAIDAHNVLYYAASSINVYDPNNVNGKGVQYFFGGGLNTGVAVDASGNIYGSASFPATGQTIFIYTPQGTQLSAYQAFFLSASNPIAVNR
ncbi:MAG: hypothetical protein JOZ38_06890 [Candidatus Eremiobacteraeota bacterium]|nr:hypothetical protein [Candidatus Eremiobacteraeota bacterium]